MPPKYRKLLDFIHDELFYASDRLVSISESECIALGLDTPDTQQIIAKMIDQSIIMPEKHMIDFKGSRKPITHEDKEFVMTEPQSELNLTGGSVGIEGTEWFLVIPVLPKFDEAYRKMTGLEQSTDTASFDTKTGNVTFGGKAYRIESELRKSIMHFLWHKRRVMEGDKIVTPGEPWQKASMASQVGLRQDDEPMTSAVSESLQQEFNQLNRTFKEKGFPIKITTEYALIQLIETR